jgi:hypothetical protein
MRCCQNTPVESVRVQFFMLFSEHNITVTQNVLLSEHTGTVRQSTIFLCCSLCTILLQHIVCYSNIVLTEQHKNCTLTEYTSVF